MPNESISLKKSSNEIAGIHGIIIIVMQEHQALLLDFCADYYKIIQSLNHYLTMQSVIIPSLCHGLARPLKRNNEINPDSMLSLPPSSAETQDAN